MTLADHVVFLVTVNHWWTKARVNLLLMATPASFNATGFAIGAMHVERGHRRRLAIRDLR